MQNTGPTDLRGCQALLAQLLDVLLNLIGSQFQPCGHSSAVGQSRFGNTFSRRVHATHFELVLNHFPG